MKNFWALGFIILSIFFGIASASKDSLSSKHKKVHAALQKLSKIVGQQIVVQDIQATPMDDLLQVTANNSVFYVSQSGKYVVIGELLDLNKDMSSWDLTEQAMRKIRLQLLSSIPEKDMIIFPATHKKVAHVTVFTDIDCPYCRKMDQEIKEYNDRGIEIRYVAFPRSGPGSVTFDKTISVWCAKDKQNAFSMANQGKSLAPNICSNHPVSMEFEVGRKLNINATPMLFFANGIKYPGYMSPQELQDFVKNHVTPD